MYKTHIDRCTQHAYTDRHTCIQTDTHAYRQTQTHTDTHTHKHVHTHTHKQHTNTYIHTNNTQTHTQINTYRHIHTFQLSGQFITRWYFTKCCDKFKKCFLTAKRNFLFNLRQDQVHLHFIGKEYSIPIMSTTP